MKQTLIFAFLLLISCSTSKHTTSDLPPTIEMLKHNIWVLQMSSVDGVNTNKYTQTQDSSTFILKNKKAVALSDYYLSDSIVTKFDDRKIGKVKTGKYIVEKNTNGKLNVFLILKLDNQNLVIKNLKYPDILTYKVK